MLPCHQMTAIQLTADQVGRVERAREILAESAAYDLAGMVGHIGRLEWHLEELLRLADAE